MTTPTLTRAAELLEARASELLLSNTNDDGAWNDDAEAREDHDEMLRVAGELRGMVEAAPEAPEQVPKPLMDVVEHILDAGHLNTEDLARLRAAWYAAQPVDLEQAAQPDEVARLVEPQTNAARDVLAERRRQIEAEGWTLQHDDEHVAGKLSSAASAYALAAADELDPRSRGAGAYPSRLPGMWPWDCDSWKPGAPRRMLVKAGALILAEIERMDRAALAAKGGDRG